MIFRIHLYHFFFTYIIFKIHLYHFFLLVWFFWLIRLKWREIFVADGRFFHSIFFLSKKKLQNIFIKIFVEPSKKRGQNLIAKMQIAILRHGWPSGMGGLGNEKLQNTVSQIYSKILYRIFIAIYCIFAMRHRKFIAKYCIAFL